MESRNRIPARAMIECLLCAKCNTYATATVGGICSACSLKAERDRLAGELAAKNAEWESDYEALEKHAQRVEELMKRYSAAQAEIAGLREALEEIASEPGCGCKPICQCRTPQSRAIELEEKKEIAKETLARTSDEHRRRIEAGVLREAATEAESHTQKCDLRHDDRPRYREIGRREVIAEMREKADRLERGE